MAINLFPVTSEFVAEVGDVDLSKPLSTEDAVAIEEAFLKYAVLIFPAQQLTADQHVAFAERFGPLEPNINTYQDEVKADRIDPRISDVSNLDHENSLLPAQSRKRTSGLANRLWHTDSIFRHVPARASLLYARIVAPIGGLTEFTDMRAAWDALPDSMRERIDGHVVEHSIFHSRAKVGATVFTDRERASLPPSKQVLVRTIPETGRRALYLASHAVRIMGLPELESTRLIEDLMAHATQRQFVYSHRWRVDDLVVWDNRCTMHRGTRYEENRWKRDMHRATVSDMGNTIETSAASCTTIRGSA
jgi:alpha-ketoglutarate-dependent 2,4-dichlorophenoxyacetate dioxygenase